METHRDFLDWLVSDLSIRILMCLEDPADLIRISSVSRFWRHFVIANGLCKQLCLRMFPQLSSVARVIELSCRMKKPVEVGSSYSVEWESLERNHRVFAFLARDCTSIMVCKCISEAISASSTDNDPEERIQNTLESRDRVLRRASYWSSKGQSDPAVPETLTYKLLGDFCVVTEINIQPFQAYFQPGSPIYSAKFVRFRMGHPKLPMDIGSDLMGVPCQQSADDKFIWTYTSQDFPMAQENCLQKFKLPEPVLCIGGILQIELLGRVQRQEMDGLFYICVSYVQVMGRPLSPTYDVEILEPSGRFLLKYYPEAQHYTQPGSPEDKCFVVSAMNMLPAGPVQRHGMIFGQLLNMLLGDVPDVEDNASDEEQLESDEEFVV